MFSPAVFLDGFGSVAQRNHFSSLAASSLAWILTDGPSETHPRLVFPAQLGPCVISALLSEKVGATVLI